MTGDDRTWRPVTVREKSFFWALRRLGGHNPYMLTGEFQCVLGTDCETIEVGTDAHIRLTTCKMYHRTKTAAVRHCAKLQRLL